MGQYKDREETNVELETTAVGQPPTIYLPSTPFKELYEKTGEEIYRITISNDTEHQIHWRYSPKSQVVLCYKWLKLGKHHIKIEPYSQEAFIKDFNQDAKSKYGIKLEIINDKLILRFSGGETIATKKWRYGREHGGAAIIIAEYPAETRKTIKLKYQIKNQKSQIKILSKRTSRKRAMPETVTKLTASKHGIAITYQHGKNPKKKKTTFIPLSSLKRLYDYKIKDKAITYEVVGKDDIVIYKFEITDGDAYSVLRRLMNISYDMLKHGIVRGRFVREEIGKKIALHFLSQKIMGNVIRDPYLKSRFKLLMKKNIRPDVFVKAEKLVDVFEVKFVSNREAVNKKYSEAFKEVQRQVNKIISIMDQLKIIIKNYGFIIVTINLKKDKYGFLYFKMEKLDGDIDELE